MELPSPASSAAEVMLKISWSPDDGYTDDEVPQNIVSFLLFQGPGLRSHYWEFLGHPRRCGALYNERAECYTRIINRWLLFLEATPDPQGPDSLIHEECRKLVLANWSRILSESKCVPGDQDLICRLRDFTLDKACEEDVERVIAWLKVSFGHIFIGYIYVHMSQIGSNTPKDVLVRWKTYGFGRYSPHRGIWDLLLSGTPEKLFYSGTSYDNVNNNISVLSLQEQDQGRTRMKEDARGKEEELQRNEEEIRRKEQEAKRKEQVVRRKEKEAEEKEEELRKKHEEVRKHEEEVRKHEEEVKKREEEVRKSEEEVSMREEEVRKSEEEVRKRAEEAQQKEPEAGQKNEALDINVVCARLSILLQAPESFKKLVDLQKEQAQEMTDLLQKVRLAFPPQSCLFKILMITCASC